MLKCFHCSGEAYCQAFISDLYSFRQFHSIENFESLAFWFNVYIDIGMCIEKDKHKDN